MGIFGGGLLNFPPEFAVLSFQDTDFIFFVIVNVGQLSEFGIKSFDFLLKEGYFGFMICYFLVELPVFFKLFLP